MTTNGLPNDVLSNLDPLALIIFIPICDLLVSTAKEHHLPDLIMTTTDLPSTRTCRYQVHRSEEDHLGFRHSSCIHDLGHRSAVLYLQDEPLWTLRRNLRGREPEPTRLPPECMDPEWLVSHSSKFND
jgi:hypothetical protein